MSRDLRTTSAEDAREKSRDREQKPSTNRKWRHQHGRTHGSFYSVGRRAIYVQKRMAAHSFERSFSPRKISRAVTELFLRIHIRSVRAWLFKKSFNFNLQECPFPFGWFQALLWRRLAISCTLRKVSFAIGVTSALTPRRHRYKLSFDKLLFVSLFPNIYWTNWTSGFRVSCKPVAFGTRYASHVMLPAKSI